jgi:hypothetical protein
MQYQRSFPIGGLNLSRLLPKRVYTIRCRSERRAVIGDNLLASEQNLAQPLAGANSTRTKFNATPCFSADSAELQGRCKVQTANSSIEHFGAGSTSVLRVSSVAQIRLALAASS